MDYTFTVMTQEQAEWIAYSWHYDGEYSFYDMEADPDDLEEFLNAETRGDSVFAVTYEETLAAFLTVELTGSQTADIGLGMEPGLTGQGKGMDFLQAVIEFVTFEYEVERMTLSVAAFNVKAIKVYRKAGFKDAGTFLQETNGRTYEFLKMELAV